MFPAPGNPPHLASSFSPVAGESRNPTLLPRSELAKFQFTFLIRHPYLSVPSYYRLSLPGKKEASQVKAMTTGDLGFWELRTLFDYLREEGLIGRSPVYTNGSGATNGNGVANGNGVSNGSGTHNGANGHSETGDSRTGSGYDICVVDSEDLMEHPDEVMSAYCRKNGVPYNESIPSWDRTEDQERAAAVIDRWGFPVTFHKQVLSSTGLSAKKVSLDSDKLYKKWVDEFGIEGANEIREAANSQLDDYNYLRQFVHRV